jgi:cell division protein FtsL
MSTIRLSQAPRAVRPTTAGANLRAIGFNGLTRSRSSRVIVATITLGALSIALLNLLLQIASSSAVYELSSLQIQQRELATTTQILGQQVDSLASDQNLADAAQKLGMISNANPVFLRLADQTVLGKPTAALGTDGRVSSNLVANSALVATSNLTDATTAGAANGLTTAAATTSGTSSIPQAAGLVPVKSNVVTSGSTVVSVVSSNGGIPASPTH